MDRRWNWFVSTWIIQISHWICHFWLFSKYIYFFKIRFFSSENLILVNKSGKFIFCFNFSCFIPNVFYHGLHLSIVSFYIFDGPLHVFFNQKVFQLVAGVLWISWGRYTLIEPCTFWLRFAQLTSFIYITRFPWS